MNLILRNFVIHRLKTAQIELDKVTAQLKEKQAKLAAIEAKVCLEMSDMNSSSHPFMCINIDS